MQKVRNASSEDAYDEKIMYVFLEALLLMKTPSRTARMKQKIIWRARIRPKM